MPDDPHVIQCAVICAGGRGTRLSSVFSNLPKALVPVFDEPIIFNQVQKFVAAGVRRFIFLLGFEAERVQSALENFRADIKKDVTFTYCVESTPLGSGGALLSVLDILPEVFYFVYCDVYFDLNLPRMGNFHFLQSSDITLLAHPNDHPHDSDLLMVDEDGRLVQLIPYPHDIDGFHGNLVNAAFYIINKKSLSGLTFDDCRLDFAQDCIPEIVSGRSCNVLVYRSPEFAKDMGTPERLKRVERQFSSRCCSGAPAPVVFLDRDGTINSIQDGEYITNPDDVCLLAGAAEAIKVIRDKGYFIMIVTNQPVVARGDVSISQLKRIHDRLEFLLGEHGAYLDAIFYCPHHPDAGFVGEIAELKVVCDCRKPGIGLFKSAARYIIPDPKFSWMVGDSASDVMAGRSFGVKTAHIRHHGARVAVASADLVVASLYEFACDLKDLT